jgi:hypothetical protein
MEVLRDRAAELLLDRMYLEYQLRQIFAAETTPLTIHRYLANEMTPPLIVTTNYDMLMERAFTEARREFHVLMTPFDSDKPAARSVLWWPPGAMQPVEADEPALFDDGRSVLYKIHGGLDPNGEWHSCVVTEDDYFEIGGRLYNGSLVPNLIGAKLSRSSFLFLGYSLRDPHVRFMLTRLNRWSRGAAHFVVNRHVSRIASVRFNRLGLQIMDMAIDHFVAELARGNAG